MAPLQDWPEELIGRVFDACNAEDALNLRLACRNINEKSFFNFKQEFFRIRRYDLSQDGCRAMTAIATDSRFASVVEELTVTLERWNHETLHAKLWSLTDRSIEHAGTRRRRQSSHDRTSKNSMEQEQDEARALIQEFDTEMNGRISLIEHGQDTGSFVKAFESFPKLRLIRLREVQNPLQARALTRNNEHVDRLYFNSLHGHCWNGGPLEGAQCSRLGRLRKLWGKLGDDIGGIHRLQLLERYHLFRQSLEAMAISGPLPSLQSLDISITDFEYANEPAAIPPFLSEHLQSLSLTFIASYNDMRPSDAATGRFGGDVVSPHTFHEAKPDDWLPKLVKSCTKLKSLVVHFGNYYMARQISYLGSALELLALEHFGLSGALLDFRSTFIYQGLVDFITHHKKTLRSLELANIKLGPFALLSSPCHSTKDLLLQLASLDRLEKISLWMFTEGSQDEVVDFEPSLESPTRSWSRPWTFSGTPEEMSTRLLQLSNEYKVGR